MAAMVSPSLYYQSIPAFRKRENHAKKGYKSSVNRKN
jgi:hypothetical protein